MFSSKIKLSDLLLSICPKGYFATDLFSIHEQYIVLLAVISVCSECIMGQSPCHSIYGGPNSAKQTNRKLGVVDR